MTEKIVQIKKRMQVARDRQKSYADLKIKPMDFQVKGLLIMLKVSALEGVVRFGTVNIHDAITGNISILNIVGLEENV
ncbi:hypothetical protein Tco_0977746 [Tanacetum coccineum]|uniref:Reverse transcriptase domain-containing protein n=1 Tax=Tanacetum coccineum TaxID=301880 RepID=A0ABQ5EKZ7_9ASTR